MTLSNHITDKIEKDLAQLKEKLKTQLREEKHVWESTLAEKRKQYHDEIEQEIRHVQNRQAFITKREQVFQSSQLLSQAISEEIASLAEDIITSSYTQQSLKTFLGNIPVTSEISLYGKHILRLKASIESYGFTNLTTLQTLENTSGIIIAQLDGKKYEWSLDTIMKDIHTHILSQITNTL